jgi:spore cortex biosynthesis protein YabQ
VTLKVQFATLLAMAACGAGLGVCFDLIGVLMREFRARRWMLAAADLLYWAAATLAVFRVLLQINDGQVRAFVFVGLALGALLYALLLGGHVRRFAEAAVRLAKRFARLVRRVFRIVVWRPFAALFRFLAKTVRLALRAAVFIGKNVVQSLKTAYRWIRRRFRKG